MDNLYLTFKTLLVIYVDTFSKNKIPKSAEGITGARIVMPEVV